MNRFRRTFALFLLLIFCNGQLSANYTDTEVIFEHRLEDLPSFEMEHILEAPLISEEIPLSEEFQEVSNDTLSLVAAKSLYDDASPNLAPSMLRIPNISEMIQSHQTFLENIREDVVVESFLNIPLDTKIVGLKGKEIRTLRKARLTGVAGNF